MFSFKLNIKNLILCIVLVLLLILYIFNIIPIYGFEKVGTRVYLSVISFIIVLYKFKENKYYKSIILANWSQVLFSLFAAIVNGTDDYWYVQFAIRNILYINGALMIAYFMPKEWVLSDYIKLIIIAILVNSIIATMAFLSPSVMNVLTSIQSFSDEEKIERTAYFSVRMIGLGSGKFYVGGIINGMGLLLTFYLLAKKEINNFIAIVLIFVLFFVGVFIARTTIVGFVIGLLLFFVYSDKPRVIWISVGLVVFTIFAFSVSLFENLNTSHAFEFFTLDTDSYRKTSTMTTLSHMYNITLSEKTLLIGDGLSKGPVGGYYMGTDVGWLRNILYFGVLGTFLGYVYYELHILKMLKDQFNEDMKFFFMWFLFLVLLNFKGLPDFNFMIFLLIAYPITEHKTTTRSRNRTKVLSRI